MNSKQKTPIEELKISIKSLYVLGDITIDAYTHLMEVASYLLTKEKEQREEEIKSVAVDAYIAGYEKGNKCSLRFSVGSAYEYYNEVIKGRN